MLQFEVFGWARDWTWNHGCDEAVMQVILHARSFSDPSQILNGAHFYRHGVPTPLYSYALDDRDPDKFILAFTRYTTPRSEIPEGYLPSLDHVSYDLTRNSTTGTCFGAAGNSRACLTGSFVPWSSFSLHENTTATVDRELRITTKGWSFDNEPPALRVHRLDEAGTPGPALLKTSIPYPSDKTQLKVCITRPDSSVLVALGFVFKKHAELALKITAPTSNG